MSIKETITAHIEVAQKLFSLTDEIERACTLCMASILRGGKILLAGNGGSAADAQHIAAEFVGRFEHDRRALPAIALTVDTSAITAISNDYGYDYVFARQIEALGTEGDVFIGISTSGNSPSIIAALEKAQEKGLKTLVFSGKKGGLMKEQADIELIVPSDVTARIQEMHILIGHIICAEVEKRILENS